MTSHFLFPLPPWYSLRQLMDSSFDEDNFLILTTPLFDHGWTSGITIRPRSRWCLLVFRTSIFPTLLCIPVATDSKWPFCRQMTTVFHKRLTEMETSIDAECHQGKHLSFLPLCILVSLSVFDDELAHKCPTLKSLLFNCCRYSCF